MPYPIKFSTALGKPMRDKLREALEMTSLSWTFDNLPDGHYARSGSFVIADWSRIWGADPNIPETDRPILVGAKALYAQPAESVAQYIVKSITYWTTAHDKTRRMIEGTAHDTYKARNGRAAARKHRADEHREKRTVAKSMLAPLPERTIRVIRPLLNNDPRFSNDRVKFLSNVIRNVGSGGVASIHFLFARFRGHKVAAICTTTPQASIDALKAWEAAIPNARRLIDNLPDPTHDPRSDWELFDALADALDSIPGKKSF